MTYLFFVAAIIAEVIGTSALKASVGFTKIFPSMIVVIAYGVSFYCLSIVLKTIPIGVAYAIWSGLGIVLIAIVGLVVFNQKLDFPAIVGMLFIITGVVIMNVFSNTVAH
jgi:small multidrug resistance pump